VAASVRPNPIWDRVFQISQARWPGDRPAGSPTGARGTNWRECRHGTDGRRPLRGYTDVLVSDLKSDLAALKLERSPERSGRAAVRLLVLLPLAALGAGAWMWITRERPFAVIVSVLAEALGLAAAGGLLGGLLVYAAFNGYQTSTINVQTFSQVAFAFAVTPALLVQGLAYALVMGLAGGVLPAIKAARLPISSALREL
jgi:hypothetical protein